MKKRHIILLKFMTKVTVTPGIYPGAPPFQQDTMLSF